MHVVVEIQSRLEPVFTRNLIEFEVESHRLNEVINCSCSSVTCQQPVSVAKFLIACPSPIQYPKKSEKAKRRRKNTHYSDNGTDRFHFCLNWLEPSHNPHHVLEQLSVDRQGPRSDTRCLHHITHLQVRRKAVCVERCVCRHLG